ncbi:MAG: PRC and DUF2382 domain-containing protein [Nocardioidaceae bacterium]|nr:PRC and DUF2382 domain-containing protein [Nocardioidaceae bacterium]
MLEQNQIDQVSGADAYGVDGKKIGKVGEVYLDDQTGRPEWITVNTGSFGTSESFVPLSEATFSGDRLTVPYDNDKIKGAPNVSADGHLSPDEEREFYAYYGVGDGSVDVQPTSGGNDTSRQSTDGAVTRSEEQLRVGTRTEEVGRARLRKYVVTEKVTQTVPVSKERAVLEREPITEANIDKATAGAEIQENEHEIRLFEEEPVVQKTTTPVERVRLGTEVVTENETVTDEVRKERVATEGDVSSDAAYRS